ncbi:MULTISPECIES: hypothetical protein [unclassified Clostridioides]|uniref:hypothetical protein n=1 Tax=unclassified Clostridioides TaxID=2635829 RepID=UPI001D0C2F89|nr:hypothetical protein [Clostridioides sp. ES-S-0049-03]MCC0672268.1 hypothetical protein [Clostridioides sp. ES-S-0145-01]MCC0677976.1 hypothetical protein [Clostridioides sp. ES-W-0018-02]MCC0701448.1 hypothetical protein [Clostridioides sp. ES-S-0049-02]MCC0707314.1 hypothetical protein [Clostridioides sp. ES-S-0190-01]MCC0712741.1 hypothetical protein [Clostridioides sp. ES-W-0017-02]MCC0761380.1 hypothetical protein [Clostridioides sp. ES-S-0006-03]
MLKLGEKIIYELSDGFELSGISRYSKESKKLHITNLGNIIISKADEVNDESGVKYIYSFSDNKKKLEAVLEGSQIIIYGDNLPFYIKSENSSKNVTASLTMKITLDEYDLICKNQREFIFYLKDNMTILSLDDNKFYMGGINKDNEKFIFISGKNRFEINFDDIERYILEDKRVSLKGYFHMEREGLIVRSISIFNNNVENIVPADLSERVKDNKKIGNLPKDCEIVFCKISGNIDGFDYKNTNMLLVKYQDQLIFINKKSKKTIVKSTKDNCSKLILGEDIILYDNKNVFNLHINDKNKEAMQIEDLKDIENEIVGYTLKHAPFFIQEDFNSLTIMKSFQKEIISIKNSDVKDIVINRDIESKNSDFVETEIKFNNQKIILNLSRSMVQKLMQDVFIYAKKPLLKDVSVEILYKNWSKAMNDMIIFNFFGNIYYMKSEFDKVLERELNDEIRIEVINALYNQIQEQRNNLDLISAYTPRILENQDIELFEKYNAKLDVQVFRQIKNLFFDLSYNISSYLDGVEKSLDNIIFVISGEDKKRYNYRMLKESESANLDVFLKQAISRLNHLVENMYPYYVDETSREMFKLFEVLWKNYKNINDDSIKEVLFERITNTYVFRQLTLNNNTNERRKDIIEKIYNSVDYGANKLDENMFFTGGMKYVK